MSFNTSKCQHLPITNKRNPIKSDYSLHNQRLETVKDVKYLGVNLNEKLNWSNHIDNICKKANSSSAFFCRNLRGTSRSTKRTAFVTISRPVLEFASACWDPASSVLKDKIEIVQRRTARRIYSNFNKDCSPSALLKDLDLPSLKARRKASKINLVSKIMNGESIVINSSDYLQINNRFTRGHQQKLKHLQCRTSLYANTFYPSAIREWNTLPANLIENKSKPTFKENVRKHFSQIEV